MNKMFFKRVRAVAFVSLALLFAVLAWACEEKIAPEDMAAMSAKGYYGHLIAGEYDAYLAGINGVDSLPAGYREQLITNARQFMARQKEEHGGIAGVEVIRAKADSTSGYVNVFLLLTFADSLHEEIVVPMLETSLAEWRMK